MATPPPQKKKPQKTKTKHKHAIDHAIDWKWFQKAQFDSFCLKIPGALAASLTSREET